MLELPQLTESQTTHSASNRSKVLSNSHEVYRRYFRSDFEVGKYYVSPLRAGDNTPSFNIYEDRIDRDILLFKDWGGASGNCIDFVMIKFNVDFKTAMTMIERDIRLDVVEIDRSRTIKDNDRVIKIFPYMDSRGRYSYTDTDRWYWEHLHKTSLNVVLKEGAYSIREVWIDGASYVAAMRDSPVYYYHYPIEGSNYFKLYVPFIKDRKWLSNLSGVTSRALGGLNTLSAYGKELIITKSDKDRIVLKGLGFNAINVQGEDIPIHKELLNELKERFETIYLLWDNDYNKPTNIGKKLGDKYQDMYDVGRILIPEDMPYTDTAELIQKYDTDILTRLINKWKNI